MGRIAVGPGRGVLGARARKGPGPDGLSGALAGTEGFFGQMPNFGRVTGSSRDTL